MEILVESKTVSIKVRSVEGYVVCIKCRGNKTLTRTLYSNPQALQHGGLWGVTDQVCCPSCSGLGFWKDTHHLMAA